ncbi:DUF2997 domain-containing protein [Maioricimonas sp. JC845]|uniref:DUF2997 domain-containing protein n=1 Tax=Maioricimonas sp. JC845 TaxID=3232138 RepID=UPI00345B3AE2
MAPDGQARLETRGFAGSACRDASKFLESALGRQSSEQLTAEYHQSVGPTQVRREQLGTNDR